ncbi:HAD family hydrolase [Paenibacillus alkalitolerans]|uniref:HAD family hydrolase n=1 Tax=Paenibacillus alkalitolerans TaxID=2799335 RepID=UPI0018F4D4B2|nr:HAD family hydrolase [Paenibacillus alkalitolerans]
MKNQAVIFDLDNTLLDRKSSLQTFANKLFDKYIDKGFSKEQLFQELLEADGDGYRGKEEVYAELLYKLPWENTPSYEEFIDFWNIEFPNSSELMGGALEVLGQFKSHGYKLGIITNGKSKVQNRKIDSVHIRDYFDSILISEEVGCKKPNKEIFDLSIKELKVDPTKSFFIGDHPLNDVFGAANAGINAIWLEGCSDWDDSIQIKKYQVVKKLEDILCIIP